MELAVNQPEEVQNIVKPVVQRNAYFADPALLLCSMLESEDNTLRHKAVSIIQQIKSKPQTPPRAHVLKGIRKHVNPTLQWGSRNWWEIIELEKARIDEPRILERITNDELENMLQTPACFPKYPCHSQSVERAVKLVSTAAKKVYVEERRHSFILAVCQSRKDRKPFETKKQYSYNI